MNTKIKKEDVVNKSIQPQLVLERRDELLKGKDFADVYEKTVLEGANNVYVAKISQFKEWLNNNRDEFQASEFNAQTKSNLKIELKQLKKQLRHYAENVDERSLFK